MSGKRYNGDEPQKNNKKTTKIITTILLLIFISIMIFSGTKIFIWFKENMQNKDVIESISNSITIDENIEDVDKYNVDFESLKQKNSDTVAWLKVNGTDIEYPVVKSSDNDYYLTRSFDKTYNGAGWIFMDCRNKADGTDKNTVVYGHNRRDGSMFGTLQRILTEDWQNNKENYTIPFITESKKEEYQVFSIYKIEKEDYYITTDFSNDSDFTDFVENIKSRSEKDFETQVNSDDKILTLSTCANNNNYRVVLHAKKINKE